MAVEAEALHTLAAVISAAVTVAAVAVAVARLQVAQVRAISVEAVEQERMSLAALADRVLCLFVTLTHSPT
jgi:uncharacterized protein YaeQ